MRLAEQARPTAMAQERVLPVHDALASLLPGGLQRGSSVQVAAGSPTVATSLALSLLVAPSAAGSWVAVVGLPSLGLAAAAGLGVDLRHLVLVAPPPPREWATVVATMVAAFDVVVVGPPIGAGGRPVPVRPGDATRLASRARERGSTLVRLGPAGWWPEAADLSLTATRATWTWAGDRRWDADDRLGRGRGHLRARRATVELSGRRGAARPRVAELWLPGPSGHLAVAEPLAEVRHLAPAVGSVAGTGDRDRDAARRRWAARTARRSVGRDGPAERVGVAR